MWIGVKKGDTRHVFVKFKNDVELHNFYVPAGGDEARRFHKS